MTDLSRLVAPVLLAFILSALPFPCGAQPQRGGRGVEVEGNGEVTRWPGEAKRYALIVGVDKYASRQINSLNGASNDARVLRDALVEYAGFPPDQVILLASDQPAERQPTRSIILSYLSNLRGLVPKDGLLLVAFSGHGIERDGHAYLLPSDAISSRDAALLEDTAISVERIKASIRATRVGQVMLVLDACRNDPVPGRSDAGNYLTAAYAGAFNFDTRNREVEAFATLYATAVGQRAYEYGEKRQGYFTYAFVEALKGRAANERGEVTLSGLVKYLQAAVPKYVARDLGADLAQRPFAVIEGYKADELVIAVSNARPTSASPPPEAKRQLSSDEAAALARGMADTFLEQALEKAQAKQYAEGVELTRRALAQGANWSASRSATAHYLLAFCLTGLKREVEADKAVEEGLRLDPENKQLRQMQVTREAARLRERAAARLQTATEQYKAGKFAEAAKTAQEAIDLNAAWQPQMRGSAYGLLARSNYELGHFAEADAAIKRALEAEPENQEYRRFEAELAPKLVKATPAAPRGAAPTPSALVKEGQRLEDAGQLKEAEAKFREAVRLAPQDAAVRFSLGRVLNSQGRSVEGEAVFREALRLDVKRQYQDYLYLGLGDSLLGQGKSGEAESAYRTVIAMGKAKPSNEAVAFTAHLGLGIVCLDQNKLVDGERELRQALQLDAANAWAHYYLGRVLRQQGRWPAAEASYREALRLRPADPQILNALGYGLVEQNQKLDEAAALLEQAAKASPENGLIRDSLGWAYFKLGRLQEAERHLLSAAEREPQQAEIREHLGDLYARQGRFQKARIEWQLASVRATTSEQQARLKTKLGQQQ